MIKTDTYMKNIMRLFVFATLCITCIPSAYTQKVFTEIAKTKGVTSIYVGKAMLRIASGSAMQNMMGDKLNIDCMLNYLDSIEIITCKSPDAIAEMEKVGAKVIDSLDLEVLTEVEEDNMRMVMMGAIDKNQTEVKTVLIYVNDNGEVAYIVMRGNIPVSVLNKLINNDM